MATDFWEPVTFEVGDRVVVLPHPECRYCRATHDREVGRMGTVRHTNHDWSNSHCKADPCTDEECEDHEADYQSHHYWVELDEPVEETEWAHFAAIELEVFHG